MQIDTGLFPHMVLQRAANNRCDALITGRTSASGKVTAQVFADDKPISGFAKAKTIGRARAGKFKATLTGVPVGGPYRIELAVVDPVGETVDQRSVTDVLVGDVWLCAGQSNMQGAGLIKQKHKANANVRAFFMGDRWGTARDPIHDMWNAVDGIHHELAGGRCVKGPGGTGPAVAFGVDMFEHTKVPQGVIASAHGGTTMSQWSPTLHETNGKSTLFSAAMRRVKKNGGHIAGIIWYQGESDTALAAARAYTPRMKEMIAAFRKQIGCKTQSPMPVAIVQISRVAQGDIAKTNHPAWNMIQDQQRRLPRLIRGLATVPTLDLSLVDWIHIDAASQHETGRRLAGAMRSLRGDKGALPAPIELDKVTTLNTNDSCRPGVSCLEVRFKNVVGYLTSHGRPNGFSVNIGACFHTELYRDRVRLYLQGLDLSQGSLNLSYGAGMDPYCNIYDAAGRALPGFGPVPLGQPMAVTPFMVECRVSLPQPAPGSWNTLSYPKNTKSLGLYARKFAGNFCDLHTDYPSVKIDEPMYFLVSDFNCAEPMKLAGRFGYDGPTKIWLDGKQILNDPKGTNPAVMDEAVKKLSVGKGKHELMIGFSSNAKAGWGVYARLQRCDVTPRQIEEGEHTYHMPRWLG